MSAAQASVIATIESRNLDTHFSISSSSDTPFDIHIPALPAPARPTSRAVHSWRAPGTCGELLQGAIDGRDFMVNCPIDLYATAHAVATDGSAALTVRQPEAHAKVLATLELLQRRRGHGPGERGNGGQGATISVQSPIPRSKGMASSTADASAALAAYAACRGIRLGSAETARLLTAVEPSDCTHFAGVAHVDFITGDLLDQLPAPVGLKVLVLDCGGEVQTLGFDRARARAVYARERTRLAAALRLLKRGLRTGCNRTVAQAASESAALSQLILPKAQMPELRVLAAEWGALGINCAHSGTVLGLLYEDAPDIEATLRWRVACRFGADLSVIGAFHIIGGGNHALA